MCVLNIRRYIWRSYSLSFVLYYCRRHLDLQMNPRGALYLRVLHCTLYHVLQLIHFQGWHCTLYHCTKGGRWRRSEFKWLRNTWFEPHLLPRSIGIIRFYLSLNSNPFERVLLMYYLLLQCRVTFLFFSRNTCMLTLRAFTRQPPVCCIILAVTPSMHYNTLCYLECHNFFIWAFWKEMLCSKLVECFMVFPFMYKFIG